MYRRPFLLIKRGKFPLTPSASSWHNSATVLTENISCSQHAIPFLAHRIWLNKWAKSHPFDARYASENCARFVMNRWLLLSGIVLRLEGAYWAIYGWWNVLPGEDSTFSDCPRVFPCSTSLTEGLNFRNRELHVLEQPFPTVFLVAGTNNLGFKGRKHALVFFSSVRS